MHKEEKKLRGKVAVSLNCATNYPSSPQHVSCLGIVEASHLIF